MGGYRLHGSDSREYFEAMLQRGIGRISKGSISNADKQDILNFLRDMQAKGITARRLLKYVPSLSDFSLSLKAVKTNFREAKETDLKELIISLDKDSRYSDWTKHDRRIMLKRFYKWLLGDDEDYPKIVKWIRSPTPKNKILPEYLLTEEEVLKMIDAADTTRDKAFVYVLYESGARVGEMLSLQIKDITFGEHLTSIQVKGKTGQRRIPIVASTAHLSNWLNVHPFKDNMDAYVWSALYKSRSSPEASVCHKLILKMLRKIAKRAGVNKRVNPHTFRHSRATHLAKKLTEAQLKQFFGWVQSSDMASQYVHLSGRDLDNAVLGLYGITTEEEKSAVKISQKKCPRCEMPNPSNFMLCRRCGSALNDESAMQVLENKHEQSLSVMSEVIRQFKELENKGFDLQQFSRFMESWAKANGEKHEP